MRSLRDLPSVNDVIERLAPSAQQLPHALVAAEVRQAIDAARDALKAGDTSAPTIESTVEAALAQWTKPSLRHVINATGVVLHTNLGRAPLAPFHAAIGYSNLEYDLERASEASAMSTSAKLAGSDSGAAGMLSARLRKQRRRRALSGPQRTGDGRGSDYFARRTD